MTGTRRSSSTKIETVAAVQAPVIIFKARTFHFGLDPLAAQGGGQW